MGEKILVFSKELLQGFDGLPGITKDLENISYFFKACVPYTYFVDRNIAESDESLLQVIPYVVIHHMDTYATYRRTVKGGEERLHDKFSIGLGGHINTDDLLSAVSSPQQLMQGCKFCQEIAIMSAMRREIYEEIPWANTTNFINVRPRMLLYDDSDAVGRVHFGVVFEAHLQDTPTIGASEEEIGDFGWKTMDQLIELKDRLEGWSKMLLDHI